MRVASDACASGWMGTFETEQLSLDLRMGHGRARTTDPDSSHRAADRLERSGELTRQARIVLALLECFPGLSSKQLAEASRGTESVLDRYQVARRLPDLERAGYARRSKEQDGDARWFPIERRMR